MFSEIRDQLSANFKEMSAGELFYVGVDREEAFEKYLSGFPEAERQEYNCNCCKSFIRQWSGIVSITDNKVRSIWDGIDGQSTQNLSDYIHSRPITEVFRNEFAKCGTEKNHDPIKGITWTHLFVELPQKFVLKSNIDVARGEFRTTKEVLKRALDEFTIDTFETVLELISQNSLYRGNESEAVLRAFLVVLKEYGDLTEEERDPFAWVQSRILSQAVCRLRNTAIGTLLEDIQVGLDLDTAVGKFERMVAPTNYKRTTAIATPRMIEDMKKTLQEEGLLESLNRRLANESDLNVNDILFTSRKAVGDVFSEMIAESVSNPKSFSKVEEVSVADFMEKVLPTAKSIEVLFENRHLPNLVSLVTGDPNAARLFKWDNPFSWSYTGNVTDSIKERVKQAGGNVEGELRVSLSWSNYDDLDLHVIEPNKNKIWYSQKRSSTSGFLDIDMNAGSGTTRTPVENVIWTDKRTMLEGTYQVIVNNFSKRETTGVGFSVEIECQGEVCNFEFTPNPKNDEDQHVVDFVYNKITGISFPKGASTTVSQKEKWAIKTNVFHKVSKLMLSPNHWGQPVGNKHFMFFLENCVSDEPARPFFNEFLRQDLDKHRKGFEMLGARIPVEKSVPQLSGLGFSDTQRNSLIVRVTGQTQRIVNVKF